MIANQQKLSPASIMNREALISTLVEIISAKFLLFLAAFIFCLLFCPFSPYDSLVKELDYACFFMAGKAWHFGYLPYIDFIDVKGPLLFLVFRIGYALSPGSTVGIFVLFNFILFSTLLFVQLAMKLYLKNEILSSTGAILLLSLRTLSSFTLYGRAEDIIALPIAMSVYFGVICFKTEITNKNLILFSCILGVCCALTFLIKFNNCLYFFGVASATSIVLISKSKWSLVLRFCCFGMVAYLLTLLPFAVYMYLNDIWEAFIRVYFQLNMQTYENMGECELTKIIPSIALRLIDNIYIVPTVLFLLISVIQNNTSRVFSRSESFYFLVSAICLFFSGCGAMPYYMIVCCFSVIPLIIAVLHRLSAPLILNKGLTLCFASVLPLWIVSYNDKSPSIIWSMGVGKPYANVFSIDQILAKDKYAKVMYYNSLDLGFGVKGESLPAFPYWMRLNGLPSCEHEKMQIAIQNHLADYVIVSNASEIDKVPFLKNSGYKLVATCRLPQRVDLWKLSQEEQRVKNTSDLSQ